MGNRTPKYSDELLAEAAASCTSIAGVCEYLGISPHGANHSHIKERIRVAGIDVGHFRRRPNATRPRFDPDAVLVVREKGRARGEHLRRALIAKGVDYSCATCRMAPFWHGQTITLHVDHIDGDALDCRQENLRFLCPNCHSQTKTYGRGNGIAANQWRASRRLTPHRVLELRERWGPYVKGERRPGLVRQLAREFGVSEATVRNTVKGIKWRGVRAEDVPSWLQREAN